MRILFFLFIFFDLLVSSECREGDAARHRRLRGSACGFAASAVCVSPDDAGREPDEDAGMFGSTYAVSWLDTFGKRCTGRLDIEGQALVLTGLSEGCRVAEALPFSDISDVHLERGRLCLTGRNGRRLSIGSLDAPGVLRELADRVTAACVM
jgi:hypothetical protein